MWPPLVTAGVFRCVATALEASRARAFLGEEEVYQHKNGRSVSARGRLNEAVCRAALMVRERS
jgi:hypothetical protein